MEEIPEATPAYEKIYSIIRMIPPGKVATYGQISKIVGSVSARMVGYALSALQEGKNVPWQRVINSQGKISTHGDGWGTSLQKHLLEEEGILFDSQGKVDFTKFGWEGPRGLR